MYKYLTTLLLITMCLCVQTRADDGTFWKLGIGLDDKIGTTKLLSGGYQGYLIGIFDYQLEAGAFQDAGNSVGIVGFGGASVGISVKSTSGVYAKVFAGPSLITNTDDRLSSILEFNDDIELGIRDSRNVCLGLDFKHFSNAGLFPPNIGRDFLLLKVQIPF